MSGLSEDDAPPDDLPPPPTGPGLFGDMPAVARAPEPAVSVPYRVLARKYRPTDFSDLIGQAAMVRTLRNAFATGRIAHAYMLTGVRGVGKTTTARIIARALNCIGRDGKGGPTIEPCGVCDNCRAILADRHPDVTELDAASNNGVDEVREIIEAVRFRPMQARTRVFILDEVHMLSKPAFNALLKTLEEPPPHVKFIFATTEIRRVPVTVLSRCQRFDLRRVSVAEMSAHFDKIAKAENIAIAPAALDMIARAADGSVRDGLSLLDQAISQVDTGLEAEITAASVGDMLGLADREAVFDVFDAVMAGKPADALAITEQAHQRGADLGVLLADLLDLVHTLSRLKSISDLRHSNELPEAERTRGAALADALSVPTLGRAWQMLLKGIGEVEAAPDRSAAAEMVLIRLCHVADMPPPAELMRRLSGGTPSATIPTAPPAPPSGGRGLTMAGGMAQTAQMTQPRPELPPKAPITQLARGPTLKNFRDVVALVAERREALLHAQLLHAVHLVRFAPPVIELRPEPDAPRDLCSRLAALLSDATGTRWTIAISKQPGDPTIAEQGRAADRGRRANAADHPLVRAILAAFPGARIESVRDATADAYGLAPEPELPIPGLSDVPEPREAASGEGEFGGHGGLDYDDDLEEPDA